MGEIFEQIRDLELHIQSVSVDRKREEVLPLEVEREVILTQDGDFQILVGFLDFIVGLNLLKQFFDRGRIAQLEDVVLGRRFEFGVGDLQLDTLDGFSKNLTELGRGNWPQGVSLGLNADE